MATPLTARIRNKHDTTANWNAAIGFIPMAGEIIIYDDFSTITVQEGDETVTKYVPGIKIGTGNAYVQDLPFANESSVRHYLDMQDEITNETLVFYRD